MQRAWLWLVLLVSLVARVPIVQAFDHSAWTDLLQRHVVMQDDGTASSVDYAGFQRDQAALTAYLEQLSAVAPADFEAWARADRLAFLINAYNAFTVSLILTRYPELDSIRQLGSLLRSPWKRRFVPLLGRTVSLDDIEHGMIRGPGGYDEPRIHFAVNCASIGCPALLPEAFTGAQLEVQLERATVGFLGDRSRNRLAGDRLEVSSLFKWYGEDFAAGWRGVGTLHAFLLRYADALDLPPEARAALADESLTLFYLDYDWALNAAHAPVAGR